MGPTYPAPWILHPELLSDSLGGYQSSKIRRLGKIFTAPNSIHRLERRALSAVMEDILADLVTTLQYPHHLYIRVVQVDQLHVL